MEKIAFLSLKKITPLALFLIFVIQSAAQTTYKVVCDKKDNTVKVIESENRSPDFVPIKAGFPFRQLAEQWIDENYSTTRCNPREIIKSNQAQQSTITPTTNNSSTLSNPPPPPPKNTLLQPRRSGSGSNQKFRNTSFHMNAKFSNLGEAFRLNEKLMYGGEAGIEQLIGNAFYLGTGINMDFFFSKMDNRYNIDNEIIYFFKIPAFIGYRNVSKKTIVMYEAGVALNTKFIGTELTLESFGKTANPYSFDFLARMKVGSEKVMLELGADIWFTQIFETGNFNMTAVYVGLCFNF